MFSNGRRSSTRCAAQCLTSVHAQVSVTTYHNDLACTLSIVGGPHDVLYIGDKHDSIQADARTTAPCYTAQRSRKDAL